MFNFLKRPKVVSLSRNSSEDGFPLSNFPTISMEWDSKQGDILIKELQGVWGIYGLSWKASIQKVNNPSLNLTF